MTDEQKRAEAEMRAASGAVDDDRPLVALLFVLMRDHVTPGCMEEVFENHVAVADGKTQEYSNGWLARHAQNLADRIERACVNCNGTWACSGCGGLGCTLCDVDGGRVGVCQCQRAGRGNA